MQTKFISVCLFIAVSVTLSRPSAEQHIFQDVIEGLFNYARETLGGYDPLHITDKELSFLGHYGEINNLNAEGFSNFFISHLSLISGLVKWQLDVTLEMPKVALSVQQWQVDGRIFYGNGTTSIDIDNFKVSITAKYSLFSGLTDFHATPSIAKAEVLITGIYNNKKQSQEVANKISCFLNDTFNNDKQLHDRISKILFDAVQRMFTSFLG